MLNLKVFRRCVSYLIAFLGILPIPNHPDRSWNISNMFWTNSYFAIYVLLVPKKSSSINVLCFDLDLGAEVKFLEELRCEALQQGILVRHCEMEKFQKWDPGWKKLAKDHEIWVSCLEDEKVLADAKVDLDITSILVTWGPQWWLLAVWLLHWVWGLGCDLPLPSILL